MSHSTQELRPIFLYPGEMFACFEPSLVTTVLGSCVAVTMHNPRLKLGAICHAQLAAPALHEKKGKDHPQAFKYVSLAIPAMIEVFQSHGISLEAIEVKLFGGANVLNLGEKPCVVNDIGANNIHRAQKVLQESCLPISRSHVGGTRGRKLIFNTLTGEVLLKQIQPSNTQYLPYNVDRKN